MQGSLESKPIHHIDTSIIVESEKTVDGKFCRKYLQKDGYNYRGVFSLHVLGALLITMIIFKDNDKRHTFLDIVSNLIYTNKIEFYTHIDINKTTYRIKEIDTRLQPTDIDIIACAIEDGANNLVTIDRKLIGNTAIEKEFGLKIVHPKQLP